MVVGCNKICSNCLLYLWPPCYRNFSVKSIYWNIWSLWLLTIRAKAFRFTSVHWLYTQQSMLWRLKEKVPNAIIEDNIWLIVSYTLDSNEIGISTHFCFSAYVHEGYALLPAKLWLNNIFRVIILNTFLFFPVLIGLWSMVVFLLCLYSWNSKKL